jgi:hypothetical protein
VEEVRSFRACAGRSVNRKLASAPKLGRKLRIRPWVQSAIQPTLTVLAKTLLVKIRLTKSWLAKRLLAKVRLAKARLAKARLGLTVLALLPELILQRKLLAQLRNLGLLNVSSGDRIDPVQRIKLHALLGDHGREWVLSERRPTAGVLLLRQLLSKLSLGKLRLDELRKLCLLLRQLGLLRQLSLLRKLRLLNVGRYRIHISKGLKSRVKTIGHWPRLTPDALSAHQSGDAASQQATQRSRRAAEQALLLRMIGLRSVGLSSIRRGCHRIVSLLNSVLNSFHFITPFEILV